MPRGPGSKVALDPAVLVAFVESLSWYVVDGIPRRRRLLINNRRVCDLDARIIRRWRSGTIASVTVDAASKLLANHDLTLQDLKAYAAVSHQKHVLRGQLNI